MPEAANELPKILSLYLQIAQYPILAHQIRRRMRDELYRRGVITPARLEVSAEGLGIRNDKTTWKPVVIDLK